MTVEEDPWGQRDGSRRKEGRQGYDLFRGDDAGGDAGGFGSQGHILADGTDMTLTGRLCGNGHIGRH